MLQQLPSQLKSKLAEFSRHPQKAVQIMDGGPIRPGYGLKDNSNPPGYDRSGALTPIMEHHEPTVNNATSNK